MNLYYLTKQVNNLCKRRDQALNKYMRSSIGKKIADLLYEADINGCIIVPDKISKRYSIRKVPFEEKDVYELNKRLKRLQLNPQTDLVKSRLDELISDVNSKGYRLTKTMYVLTEVQRDLLGYQEKEILVVKERYI